MPTPAPIAALRTSHDHLAGLVAGIDEETATRMSYCSDWTIAQVLSHIGSGAEIGLAWLTAAIEHTEPIGQDDMTLIWDTWNKRAPLEQVTAAIESNAALVTAYESATAEQLTGAHIKLFGMLDLDGVGTAAFRLPEAAIHTWDVEVTLDPAARVAPDAVELIVDQLAAAIGWFGKPQGRAWSVTVETSGPSRTFTLTSGDAVTLASGPAADGDGVLRLPAEAFVRLVYGRHDDSNADGTEVTGSVSLTDLRATFPGF